MDLLTRCHVVFLDNKVRKQLFLTITVLYLHGSTIQYRYFYGQL